MKSLVEPITRTIVLTMILLACSSSGCVRTDAVSKPPPFEPQELDACLAYVIDQSPSFESTWEEGGFQLFLKISDQFFLDSVGEDAKLVIAQLSGAGTDKVVLLEGRPSDIQRRFQSPEDLQEFIRSKAQFGGSNVYESTRAVTDYLMAMPDVSEKTRMMTVIFSDMVDTEFNEARRIRAGRKMVDSLTDYRELGGSLGVYFADPSETQRWRKICDEAGFEKGRFVIESTLVENHLLPSFE
ncbi:MAG: hypothetical protein AAFV88_12440 [Planctomycetota bacterium]